jgi:hypothetical protein
MNNLIYRQLIFRAAIIFLMHVYSKITCCDLEKIYSKLKKHGEFKGLTMKMMEDNEKINLFMINQEKVNNRNKMII